MPMPRTEREPLRLELLKVLPQRTSVLKPSKDRMLLLATAAGCTGHGNMARRTRSMWEMKALYLAPLRLHYLFRDEHSGLQCSHIATANQKGLHFAGILESFDSLEHLIF